MVLNETSNIVQVIFGKVIFGATSSTGTDGLQFGLGGTTATDFNNRTTTTNWAATTAGATNAAKCDVNTGVIYPASGTTFIWSPPAICNGQPTAGTTSSTANPACPNQTFTLSFSGTNNSSGITYQWIYSTNSS